MSQTLFVPPNKNWGLFATVTGATASDDHELSWLVDGRPGFPLRIDGGSASIVITGTSPVLPDVIAVCHHLLDAGLVIGVSGDVSGSLTVPEYPPNNVPYNVWDIVTPSSPVGDLTLTITGNTTDILIGEIVIGEAVALDPSLRISDATFGNRRYLNSTQPELSGIPPYTERARSRTLKGSGYYGSDMVQVILDWFDSQDTYAYPVPSLLIPDSDDPNDARLVQLLEPSFSRVGPIGSDVEYLVELEFIEHPRGRW